MGKLSRLFDQLDTRECQVSAQNARTNRELGLENDDAQHWRAEFERVQRENIRLRGDLQKLTKPFADCGICKLGDRTLFIDDGCRKHGDHDGIDW